MAKDKDIPVYGIYSPSNNNKKYTDEDFVGTGWHFTPLESIDSNDPLYQNAVSQGLDRYLINENNRLVPTSFVNNFLRNQNYLRQLPYQEQNDINDAALMNIRAGDRSVRNRSMTQANKTEMNNLANLELLLGGTALSVPALLAAPFATVGGIAGGLGGSWLGNKAIEKASKGKYKTWGNAVEDWTNGYIRADNGEIFNPLALVGGAVESEVLPNITRETIKLLPNNFGTRILYDLANTFDTEGIFSAFNNGRYIYNRSSLKRNLETAKQHAQTAKEAVAQMNDKTAIIRQAYNTPEGYAMPNYDDVTARFLSNRGKFKVDDGALAQYNFGTSETWLPFYESPRSNIVRNYGDYGKMDGNAWLAAHEFEHAKQFDEDFGVSTYNYDNNYYMPNPNNSLYNKLSPLTKKGSSWTKSPDEVMSEVMGYRYTNGNLPPYHQMDKINQVNLRNYIKNNFKLDNADAHNILNELSVAGYL